MADMHPGVRKMLEQYDLSTQEGAFDALREILQEIVLLALYEKGFFDHAVFYGGTALRILYGLPRFSEDLDFSLLEVNREFDLTAYEEAVAMTLEAFGFKVSIKVKEKSVETAVQSAFLKGNTVEHLLTIDAPQDVVGKFPQNKVVKIKIEVDTEPPGNFDIQEHTPLVPRIYMISSMTLPCLFAGKMHALLCRKWANRPKGRDWYDLIWYIQKGVKVDLRHLEARLRQSCRWQNDEGTELPDIIDKKYVADLLKSRIRELDIEKAKQDIRPFVADAKELDLWSTDLFLHLADQVEFFGTKEQ